MVPTRRAPVHLVAPLLLLAALGGTTSTAADKKKQATAKATVDRLVNKRYDYPTLGQVCVITNGGALKVEGIGLVVDLHGNGSDPPPNGMREAMLARMRSHEVWKPAELLASGDVAIVTLKGHVPAGSRRGDFIDVELCVPPGDTATKSIKGGRLLEAELFTTMEIATASGSKTKQGDRKVVVKGPVLVAEGGKDNEAALRRGRVLGMGLVLEERNFFLQIPKETRSGRLAKDIEYQVNQRLFDNEHNQRKGLAKAKTDTKLELEPARAYKYDTERYGLVLQRLPMAKGAAVIQRALDDLEADLNEPSLSMEASLRLEAIGKPAVPALRKGMQSRFESVRFCSAMALSYLQDSTAAGTLGRLAASSVEYRPYALSGLIAGNQMQDRQELSKLFDAPGAETRYGAFRALWAFDAKDPSLGSKSVCDGDLTLHAVRSTAEPMVHLSRNFRQEIVVFDETQLLLTPFTLKAGPVIISAAGSEGKANLAAFPIAGRKVKELHATTSLRLFDVLSEAASMGANYNDLVEMLQQANANRNLAGRLEVNALPRPMRLGDLAAFSGMDRSLANQSASASLFSIAEGDQRVTPASSDGEGRKTAGKTDHKWWDVFHHSAN